MKTIFKIARAELRLMFYSPIAWFLLIVFVVQCGIVYCGAIYSFAVSQELGKYERMFLRGLTSRLYVSQGGLFLSVMENLYLYIPLLTMGLISRELSSGTIKLLYSSPVKIRQIIYGKYLAMVGYSLLLLAVIGLFTLSGMFHIQHPEKGILASAMLGFFLLLCAYSAIGLFMSCLTSYQIVAAISTFVMIGVLIHIGSVWQEYDFIRDLTYFLSLNGRAEKILAGYITTKDIIYFLVIIYMFVALSIYKLRATTESRPAMVRAGRYTMVIVSALTIGYITSRPSLTGYLDMTSTKQWTLTPKVQRIVKDLGDAPLEITSYANLLNNFSSMGMPRSRNLNLERWELYLRYKHDIRLKYVMYYDEPLDNTYRMKMNEGKTLKQMAENYAKGRDLEMSSIRSPEQLRKEVDLRPELNRFVMKLKWKDRTTFLRIFDDQFVWPSETEVGAALKRLQKAKMPKIIFVTGDLERDINKKGDIDYKTLTNSVPFRNSLINQGFDVDTISLERDAIPADITALVLADPRVELSDVALNRLRQYISGGGNFMMTTEPKRREQHNKLLSYLGVQLMNGQIVQQDKDLGPDIVTAYVAPSGPSVSNLLMPVWKDSGRVTMPGAAGLLLNGQTWSAVPLLVTNSKTSWNKAKPLDMEIFLKADAASILGMHRYAGDSSNKPATAIRTIARNAAGNAVVGINTGVALGTLLFASEDGDQRGSYPTALALSRNLNGHNQKIVITGDADFMSQKELTRGNNSNFAFTTGIFNWLSSGEFPIDTSRPEQLDNGVNLSSAQVKVLRIVYIWILPALILFGGAAFLIRRKRN